MTAAQENAPARPALSLILRTGVAMCFIGHGAFGLITKQAWVPYFAVAGISEPAAFRLMPWVGAMDVTIGFLAFIWPCRALFAWAVTWAVWTALLRPFAGQGWPEFFERAGNYGVPLAVLVLIGLRGGWFARLPEQWPGPAGAVGVRLTWTLRLVTATLLAGHAACALVLQKAGLAHLYAVLGVADPKGVMLGVGWFELMLSLTVLVTRVPAVLIFVCAWKLVTEGLFLPSGAVAPMFEVIERGGSYIAPLALAYLLVRTNAPARIPSSQPADHQLSHA
jgi:hypothetical protein